MSNPNSIHPFQCIATITPPRKSQDKSSDYLLAACGPKLSTLNLMTGEIISEWTAESSIPTKVDDADENDRPAKKQKTAQAPPTPPNIIKLTISPDHQHAVVVTDDKAVRVFALNADGESSELSERIMPKRPCAIQILPDNATILCGDKFGDVYSLPLLPQVEADTEDDGKTADLPPENTNDSNKSFKPSASNLTVHTKRNRKALEAQLKQKNLTPKTKEPLKFEHKLLLGHVSMLTDVVYANKQVDGKDRGYIITADRDEHIRISRGPPQAHVIEGYCLGHKEFVSKICLIPGTDLLVSGGGDDWIGVWEWPAFKLRKKLDLRSVIRSNEIHSDKSRQLDDNADNIAVSGMWVVRADVHGEITDVLVVACEKERTLSYIPVSQLCQNDGNTSPWSTKRFESPVLDVTCAGPFVIISFDVRQEGQRRLRAFQIRGADSNSIDLFGDDEVDTKLDVINVTNGGIPPEKALDELLYGIANLRKRGYQDEKEDE